MIRIFILSGILSLIIPLFAYATIISIPTDYPTIQQGIDAGSDGDTVSVQPGTYVENISFNGHNIVLASLFLTTGDTNYIPTTIIDGDSSGSVVTFASVINATTILTGFTITNGSAENGAAILCRSNAQPVITYNHIGHNIASSRGGGIYCDTNSGPRITYNVFHNNSARYGGGGIYLYNSLGANIRNNLFFSNSSEDGGAICSRDSDFMIINNTLAFNSASAQGGGIYCWQNTNMEMRNTILWGNSAPDDEQLFLSPTSIGFVEFCDIQGGWTGDNNIDINPRFRDSAGGDFHLMATACGDSVDSPCIDAGYPGITDLALDCSWGLGDTTSDMGSFGGGDLIPGSGHVFNVPQDYALIQMAILAAWHTDTILVQPGIYYENIRFFGRNLTLGSMYILTGDPSYVDSTIIDGGNNDNTVKFIDNEDSTASLIGFTVQHGLDIDGSGGGILIDQASPTISRNIIKNNESADGGGIGCNYSDAILYNNVIYGNIARGGAAKGGGILCVGSGSSPRIINNEISSNAAEGPDAAGGGIFCGNCNPMVYNNNIIMNRVIFSNGSGAGAYFDNCEILMTGNIIYQNFVSGEPGNGGGIEFYGTNGYFGNNAVIENYGSRFGALHFYSNTDFLTVKNCIVRENTPFQITAGYSANLELTYCNIQDTLWPGAGNIDIVPLFRDPLYGDFHLMSTTCGDSADSPCIDAGDPHILDSLLDCSWGLGAQRSDMGAYGGGDSLITSVFEEHVTEPGSFMLMQNYPNPFNARTAIRFVLAEPQNVKITIYDILGRRVETFIDEQKQAGVHTVTLDASHLSSGVYFYRLRAGDIFETKRMLLIK